MFSILAVGSFPVQKLSGLRSEPFKVPDGEMTAMKVDDSVFFQMVQVAVDDGTDAPDHAGKGFVGEVIDQLDRIVVFGR